MNQIRFDFNNMLSSSIGPKHGVTGSDIDRILPDAARAHKHLRKILSRKSNRINLGLEWAELPNQDKSTIQNIRRIGYSIAKKYKNVISLGIGGSYLGLKAAQDALTPPYYNEFDSLRGGRPRIYFEGNNLDPEPLSALLRNLDADKTFVIVISKSGETTETKAAFETIESWLKKRVGTRSGRQILAVTDPASGSLRARVLKEQRRDALSFRSLPVLKGVGGRFSELNIGLLHLAIIGVDIMEVLNGAGAMAKRLRSADIYTNPAYLYAALNTILYRKKAKPIAIMMPFSETLKATADWYSQLLAESLGKKYSRKIEISAGGAERWAPDKKNTINAGRTPVASRGTNDLHSIHQNNIEGENNKTITFIRVEKFKHDIRLANTRDFLYGKLYSKLLSLAEEATEWALVRESRPNCAIIMPEVTPYHWGALLFFFEMATAFEGELLNVNAYDQPGVEGYKNYMYIKLRKPGMPEDVREYVIKNPLTKKNRYIL